VAAFRFASIFSIALFRATKAMGAIRGDRISMRFLPDNRDMA
jgi:hypothetical protein